MSKPKHGREVYEKAAELLDYNHETGEFKWLVSRGKAKLGELAGTVGLNGYRQIGYKGFSVLAHRLAWYFSYSEVPEYIDHVNSNRDDNRIGNLRSCSQQQNNQCMSIRKTNKSGFIGVSWSREKSKWVAQISINSKQTNLGYFTDLEDAKKARLEAEKKYFGEFAPCR